MIEQEIIINDKPNKTKKSRALKQTPASLLAIAVEQGADIDKLTKLMDLQERWEATEAKKAYIKSMSEFRSECPSIDRTKSGYDDRYQYATLADTIDQIKGLLSKHGLSHSWKTNQENGSISVTCCVTHIMGHNECTSLSGAPDTSGSKNNIQALGSTVSYLERYTLYAILGLSSKEMDNDGKDSEPQELISEEQVLQIHSKATEHEVLEGLMMWLKSSLKYNKLEDIYLSHFDMVNKRLDSAIRAKEQK